MPNDQLHVAGPLSVAAARADFEVFALGRNLARACDNAENYASPYVQNDWEVWKAARGITAVSATCLNENACPAPPFVKGNHY